MIHSVLENENSFSKKIPSPFLRTMIAVRPMGFCSDSSSVWDMHACLRSQPKSNPNGLSNAFATMRLWLKMPFCFQIWFESPAKAKRRSMYTKLVFLYRFPCRNKNRWVGSSVLNFWRSSRLTTCFYKPRQLPHPLFPNYWLWTCIFCLPHLYTRLNASIKFSPVWISSSFF